jgi:PilZ domain
MANPFRAHARHAVKMHAIVTHVSAGWQRQAQVHNVGLGGACVVVDEPLASGDAVTLSFTAPTLWDPLLLRGRVAWVAESRRAGVAFEHRAADAAFALYELISSVGYA